MACASLIALVQLNREVDAARVSSITSPVGSPRVNLYRAQTLLAGAAGAADPAAVARAAAPFVEAAVEQRPRWGEAWVARAYVAAVAQGPQSPAARISFARSYRETPFLRGHASWRIRYAVDQWSSLDGSTRRSVIREAIMLSRLSPNFAAHVRVMTAGTPLYPLIAERDMRIQLS